MARCFPLVHPFTFYKVNYKVTQAPKKQGPLTQWLWDRKTEQKVILKHSCLKSQQIEHKMYVKLCLFVSFFLFFSVSLRFCFSFFHSVFLSRSLSFYFNFSSVSVFLLLLALLRPLAFLLFHFSLILLVNNWALLSKPQRLLWEIRLNDSMYLFGSSFLLMYKWRRNIGQEMSKQAQLIIC